MRLTSRISHYHKGVFALILAPFLWLQLYFHALQEWLLDMLYNELFKIHKIPYSQITHLLAFASFSAFSLLAYHKQVEEYVSFALYALWLLNYYCAKYRTGLYVDQPAWVRLETFEDYWQWSLIVKNKCQQQQQFDYATVQRIVIAAARYGDDSFKNQILEVWNVYIQILDGQQRVVYQHAEIQQVLLKAVELAEQFHCDIKILESFGTCALAEEDLGCHHRPVVAWRRGFTSDTVRIYRNFSTVSLFRWIGLILVELGDFLFIAVISGFMQRYGFILMVLLHGNLGLPPPSERINLQTPLHIFAPDFNWADVMVFSITLLVLLHGVYCQSRRYEISISSRRVQYRIGGQLQASLNLTHPPQVLLLKGFDKTSLILINENYRLLEIKGLEEDEYDELYEMLLSV